MIIAHQSSVPGSGVHVHAVGLLSFVTPPELNMMGRLSRMPCI